jgi:adenine C2-methylase RlmN of 23S rRNA A2503 and tRNA A37
MGEPLASYRRVVASIRLVHVNVIPLNPTPGSAWDAAPKSVEREFAVG